MKAKRQNESSLNSVTMLDGSGGHVRPALQGPETAGLMLYDLEGNPRAQLDAGMEGPRLYLEDEKGFSATVGSYYSSEYAGQKHMAARVILSQKGAGVLW